MSSWKSAWLVTQAGRLGAAGLALASWSAAANAAEFERSFSTSASRLTVTTLVGTIRVEKGTGNETKVLVNVRGRDADPKWLQFDEAQGSHAKYTIKFPVEEHRKYVYPKMGSGSRSSFRMSDHSSSDNWLEEFLDLTSGDKIEVRGRDWNGALELWTDVVVQLPSGRDTRVQLGVGTASATDVTGDVELYVKSGEVTATGVEGDLVADTGSGSVDVSRVKGELSVDTGSGGVNVEDVSGGKRVIVDTGSGSVDVRRVKADELNIDTGSGGVDVTEVDVKDLSIDTGSGSVEGENVAADAVLIDTGSGGVTLDLVRMGRGRYAIETGSGGIRLALPRDLSAEFDVETGSGGIDADIDGVTLDRRRHNNTAHFSVGKGEAQVSLSTGSGGVRLLQSASR